MIYIILRKRCEPDYGYGGWTGTDTEYTDVVGYATSEERAEEVLKELRAEESRAQRSRKRRLERYVEYELEEVSEL
jgi:hypothetical protein